MSMPFVLPDWVPWWVPLVILVPVLLYALAFLFMPFSVLGVKSRLEVMESRLDDIQQEIRLLTMRLPAGRQEVDFEETYAQMPQAKWRDTLASDRPPIPPTVQELYVDQSSSTDFRPGGRREPRIVRPPQPEPRLGSLR